jgi:hypothetical protein
MRLHKTVNFGPEERITSKFHKNVLGGSLQKGRFESDLPLFLSLAAKKAPDVLAGETIWALHERRELLRLFYHGEAFEIFHLHSHQILDYMKRAKNRAELQRK